MTQLLNFSHCLDNLLDIVFEKMSTADVGRQIRKQ